MDVSDPVLGPPQVDVQEPMVALPEPASQTQPTVPVIQDPVPPAHVPEVVEQEPSAAPAPAASTPEDEPMDVAGALDKAMRANHTANDNLDYPLPMNMPVDDLDDVEAMEWTLPGSQTLTQRAFDFTNQYIDQSMFGVSPLNKIFTPQTPERIDAPLTQQELDRINNLSNLNLNRVHTPPPITYERFVDPDAEGDTDTDGDMHEHGTPANPDEDVFMDPPPRSPSPRSFTNPGRPNRDENEEMGGPGVLGQNAGAEKLPSIGGQDTESDEEMVGEEPAVDKENPGQGHAGENPSGTLADRQEGPGESGTERRKEGQSQESGPGGKKPSERPLNLRLPSQNPPHTSRPTIPAASTSIPDRRSTRISNTTVMSSSGESEGDSELSSPPPTPVRKTKPKQSGSNAPVRPTTQSTSQAVTQAQIPATVRGPSALERNPGPNFGSKGSLLGRLRSHVRGPQTLVAKPASPVCPCHV